LVLPAVATTLRAARVPAGWEEVATLPFLLFAALLVAAWLGLVSRRSRGPAPVHESLRRVLSERYARALIALALATLGAEVLLGGFPGRLFAAVGLGGLFALPLVHLPARALLRRLGRRGLGARRTLVLGNNARALEFVERVRRDPRHEVHLVGALDAADPRRAGAPSLDGVPTLGTTDDLREVLARHAVDEVVVFLPMRSFYGLVEEALDVCATAGVTVRLPSGAFEARGAKPHLSHLADAPFATYSSGPRNAWALAAKRGIDVFGSSLLLLAFSPLSLLIALAIRLTSKGPIFHVQTRAGLRGRPFGMIKFRTMVPEAEAMRKHLEAHNEVSGPVFKMRNDPRVTPVGRWLRRFSLDELPQLWNVLRGEMSLVGPRPPIPEEVRRYDWWQRRRLSMLPGLTCLWQVRGRNDVPFERWMELDLEYIDRWSLRLDLLLLCWTIPAVLRGGGV
jgi:exopolysaccharide biosynthesis polyprenyl glycosylphosphotransferase